MCSSVLFFLPRVATRKSQRGYTASLVSTSHNTSNLKPTIVKAKITCLSLVFFFFIQKYYFRPRHTPPILPCFLFVLIESSVYAACPGISAHKLTRADRDANRLLNSGNDEKPVLIWPTDFICCEQEKSDINHGGAWLGPGLKWLGRNEGIMLCLLWKRWGEPL